MSAFHPLRTFPSACRCRGMRKAASSRLHLARSRAVGLFLPLPPTLPFALLGTFFFSKGSHRLEAWLLGHRQFGPPISAWRGGSTSDL
jgi:hypothetical protein